MINLPGLQFDLGEDIAMLRDALHLEQVPVPHAATPSTTAPDHPHPRLQAGRPCPPPRLQAHPSTSSTSPP